MCLLKRKSKNTPCFLYLCNKYKIMVRKNYPFNERDEKKMINFISQILVYSVLAPLLLFGIKSFGNEDSDILENSILGVILLISSFISFLIVLPLLNISSFLVELLVHCIISFILTAVIVGTIIFIKKRNK